LNHIDTSQRLRPAERIKSLTVTTISVGVTPDGVTACCKGAPEVILQICTRRLGEAGLEDLASYVDYGASPRGPINLVVGARALALLRGRRYVLPQDVRELAKDVLRHRMVLSYEALAEGVDADRILDRVLETIAMPQLDLARQEVA